MVLKKKWLAVLFTIFAISLLNACGGQEDEFVPSAHDAGDDETLDLMPISDGVEEYKVWLEVDLPLERNSSVQYIYKFENGEVTRYQTFQDNITIDDIHDLTENEIIHLAEKVYDEYLDEKINSDNKLTLNYDDSLYQAIELRSVVTDDIDADFSSEVSEFTKDLPTEITINDEKPSLSSKYTFDLTIDETGQNTKLMKLEMPALELVKNEKINELKSAFQSYVTYYFISNEDLPPIAESTPEHLAPEEFEMLLEDYEAYINDSEENSKNYISMLENHGTFKDNDGELSNPASYELNPIHYWNAEDTSLTLYDHRIYETIYDTRFVGLTTDSEMDYALITIVDDKFHGFKLDHPDVKKDNITIEGK